MGAPVLTVPRPAHLCVIGVLRLVPWSPRHRVELRVVGFGADDIDVLVASARS